MEYASALDSKVGSLGGTVGRADLQFSEVYHKLIHSPALETLLQLEHTYALAVLEMCKARDNAMEMMQKRYITTANFRHYRLFCNG